VIWILVRQYDATASKVPQSMAEKKPLNVIEFNPSECINQTLAGHDVMAGNSCLQTSQHLIDAMWE